MTPSPALALVLLDGLHRDRPGNRTSFPLLEVVLGKPANLINKHVRARGGHIFVKPAQDDPYLRCRAVLLACSDGSPCDTCCQGHLQCCPRPQSVPLDAPELREARRSQLIAILEEQMNQLSAAGGDLEVADQSSAGPRLWVRRSNCKKGIGPFVALYV